ncbi:hypothetical protein CAS74_003938 [Pichia kudriavzevii]|mgnify:CR=1 FL=1|uniref:DNA repair protein SWI5 n=1 Tax=Pichia kudriavzevii TaxID=4909 RepID=A0A1V2LUD4_PICKU|nr:uncharacterized protein C5L36_0B08930 [Pichia kudriavzevii]AWU75651.1 hypothetical protein C5L36_0B08930 [Pichia kudriavzevii]ONH77187.1 DNA repair protein SWI5 [Pichia kudriavzevii]OUT20942.1 hypothetical protein CAS74_003938 [Pichia kudriavzevii]
MPDNVIPREMLATSSSVDPNLRLEKNIRRLEVQLQNLKEEHAKLAQELSEKTGQQIIPDYEKEMKRHIRQLKKYNELKDLSMGLIQMIADSRQLTLREIMKEMEIEEDK